MRIHRYPFSGAPSTVAVLRADARAHKLASSAVDLEHQYVVRQLAEHIVRELNPKDYLSEILAVAQYVKTNTRYTHDPRHIELVKGAHVAAQELLNGGRPCLDCDDMVGLTTGLLLSLGFECRFVTAAFRDNFFKGQRQYSHIFMQALEPSSKRWIISDPVPRNVARMLDRAVALKVWSV